MGIFENDNPTVDDIVDEFEEVYGDIDELEEQVSDDDGGDDLDPDDLFDRAEETARNESIDTLDHILTDDCDNERCNEIRNALGVDGSEESDGSDDDSDESEGEGSDEGVDDSGSGSDGDTDGSDGSGDDDDTGSESDEPWGEDENIFGESI